MPENPRLTELIGRQVHVHIAVPPASAHRHGVIVDVTGDWLTLSFTAEGDVVRINAAHVYLIEVLPSRTEEK